jgi:Domain of unknown function (DUF4157)
VTLVLDQPRAGRSADVRRQPPAPLRIGPVDDPLEHEADRVAERLVGSPGRGGLLQRACACGGTAGPDGECAECKAKRLGLQRRASGVGLSTAPQSVHETLRSSGRQLDRGTRSFFEQRLGRDLGSVRVHTDARAADSAEAVRALAYTVGKDVVFGAGRYAPGTAEGRRLLAHELAHVVQQGAADRDPGTVPRRQLTEEDGEKETLESPHFAGNDRLEGAFQNNPAMQTLGAPALQRQDDDAAVDNGSAPGGETSSSWMCDQLPIGWCTPCIPWLTSPTGFRKWCHTQVCGNLGCVDSCDPHDCYPFESTSTSAEAGGTWAESEEWTT